MNHFAMRQAILNFIRQLRNMNVHKNIIFEIYG